MSRNNNKVKSNLELFKSLRKLWNINPKTRVAESSSNDNKRRYDRARAKSECRNYNVEGWE